MGRIRRDPSPKTKKKTRLIFNQSKSIFKREKENQGEDSAQDSFHSNGSSQLTEQFGRNGVNTNAEKLGKAKLGKQQQQKKTGPIARDWRFFFETR